MDNKNFVVLSKKGKDYEKIKQYLKEKYNYDFGVPYNGEIDLEDIDLFAYVFGEGSQKLTELISYCMKNKIATVASCKGHFDNDYSGYITFSFGTESHRNDLAYYLASMPLEIDGLMANVSRPQTGEGNIISRYVTLYLPEKTPKLTEKYFDIILRKIKEYQNIRIYNPDPYIRKMIDYAFYSDVYHTPEEFDITKTHFKKKNFMQSIISVPVKNRHLIDFDKFVNTHPQDFRKK